ncbi:glycerate kinase family protein [Streptococcus hyointestinalis]|uniref:glycerate kinase family protein n=1 Tax=Streptococcus hyointestinalis TaxID=1337 RepID=UPI0013E03280|nr:glycerate kinase [Streptococcus hyointestinalis]
MHILIAPDSFKESLSALEVAEAIKSGFGSVYPEATFDLLPVGDGGEGTLSSLSTNLHMTTKTALVSDSFGDKREAPYAVLGNLAVFEMASICGLELVSKTQRNPLQLSTQGVGEMLVHLSQAGVTEVMVGVGGSSTNDGGIGMAKVLGYRFLDAQGIELEAIGDNLSKIAVIDGSQVPKTLKKLKVTIITDVTNPLCGPNGATYVFGEQKGLPVADTKAFDEAMNQFYQKANPAASTVPGSGAGGGMAAGLMTFLNGQVVSGNDAVLDYSHFDERLQKAALVIVGEGRLDRQSLSGKAPVGVARRTPQNTPDIAICGSLADDLPDIPTSNITAAFPSIPSLSSQETLLQNTEKHLIRTAQNIANLLKLNEKSW